MSAHEYTINFVNPNKGTLNIIPNTVNGPGGTSRTTDLDLVGMGNSLWGEKILENLVHILESFSSPEDSTNPGFPDPNTSAFSATTPTRGQLWYNETKGQLFVYDDLGSPVNWNVVGGLTISSTAPSIGSPVTSTEGSFWWDTTIYPTNQAEYGRNLHVFSSGTWTRVVEDYLPRDGTKVMTGILNLGTFTIESLGNAVNPTDALNLQTGDSNYVNITGDTMTGVLNMGANRLENIADPNSGDDALNLTYADNRYVNVTGDTMTGALDMGTNLINNVVDPAVAQDAATKAYVDAAIAGIAATPIATVIAFAAEAIPAEWLLCNGNAVNRTTYANLFSAIGVIYGAGDGSTTFNLPDYRGRFLRGQNIGSGIDPDSASRTDRGDGTTGDNLGTKQSHAVEDHRHYMGTGAMGYANGGNLGGTTTTSRYIEWGVTYSTPIVYTVYNANVSNNETRPTNINVSYLIYTGV